MWAASGQARHGGRWLSVTDIGSRLTYSRVSRRQAASTPDICRRQTHASGSFGHSHCALRLNPERKVLAPTALARYLRRCRSAYGFLRYNRVSASQVPLTPDCCSLLKPNAQSLTGLQRLMAHHCTLLAVNRLVLHSRSLQAQCSRCARGCRWREPTRSPPLCHLHAKHITALWTPAHIATITNSHQAHLK